MKLLILLFVITFIFLCSFVRADEIDDLIPFIIQVESGGNPNAVSGAGAIGLMQITPIVYLGFSQEHRGKDTRGLIRKTKFMKLFSKYEAANGPYMINLYIPEFNKYVGEWYLRRLKDHYLKDNYTIERMLHAWNGGITRLRKLNYDCSKMPQESREFSKKVLKLYEKQ